jgi:hypothetical protein
MDLAVARGIVIADQRESYPDLTDDELVEHAVNTVDPNQVDEGDPTAEAYLLVLAEAGILPTQGTPTMLDNGERNLIVSGLCRLLSEYGREAGRPSVDREMLDAVYGKDFERNTEALLHKIRKG